MKFLMVLALLVLSGCASYDVKPRPSHIEEVTLEDGRVVLMYVTGYSIEDFKKEFYKHD